MINNNIKKIKDLDLKNKKILIRLDLNVPFNKDKEILSYARIKASLPTINYVLSKNPRNVILMSHLGRPLKEEYDENYSLLPIFNYLKNNFFKNIILVKDYLDGIKYYDNNKIILLENVRFNKGETKNDTKLSKKYSNLCDIFVMDAFGSIHRKHSSTYGICEFVKSSSIGFLIESELKNLQKVLISPRRPMISIIGGSKVSTKFDILKHLIKISDYLIVGGGMANTFIAINHKIGKSICEKDFINSAKMIFNKNIVIPQDCFISTSFSSKSLKILRKINEINDNEIIMDIGEETIKKITKLIEKANTILWNGPLGVYELPIFRYGTELIAKAIAKNKQAFSVAGGGDTLAIIDFLNIKKNISYISTGGGAFLEVISGKKIPVIDNIKKYSN